MSESRLLLYVVNYVAIVQDGITVYVFNFIVHKKHNLNEIVIKQLYLCSEAFSGAQRWHDHHSVNFIIYLIP